MNHLGCLAGGTSLHLIPRFRRGGAEQTILSIALAVPELRMIVGSSGGAGVEALQRAGIAWEKMPLFPSTPLNAVKSFLAIRRLVRTLPIAIIHSHHRFSSLIGRAVSLQAGIPFVSTVHDIAGGRRGLSRIGMGENVTVFSETVRAHVIEKFGVRPNHVHRIAMGTAPLKAPNAAKVETIRRDLGCGPNTFLVAFCGRLATEKGPDHFLSAAKRVLAKNSSVQFWVIGDGELQLELKAFVQNLGIGDSVRFLGWQEDFSTLLGCVNLVVVPSIREGFGKVALESLMMGKPVVASRVGGLLELIRDGENGLLVSPGDPMAIALAVEACLADKQLVEKLSMGALATATNQFSMEAMGRDLRAIYELACGRTSS